MDVESLAKQLASENSNVESWGSLTAAEQDHYRAEARSRGAFPEGVPTLTPGPSPRDLARADGYAWDKLTPVQKGSYREASAGLALEGAIQHARPIPSQVNHDEFLAAIQPLCDLLNVTAFELNNDIHITGAGKTDPGLARIAFNVVAPEATIPSTTRYGEWGELSVHCVVHVV